MSKPQSGTRYPVNIKQADNLIRVAMASSIVPMIHGSPAINLSVAS